jgi:ABC-2 type transport system ATP-binding protein
MQQKTALIIALAQESEFVVLDEPNLGLDLEALSILKDILRKEAIKKTIVLTTQDVKLIEDVSDYLSLLNRGTLVYSGTMDNFNSLSEKIVCSFHVDNVLTEDIKSKISSMHIPEHPDGDSGNIRTRNRRHPDTLPASLIVK